MNIKTETVTFDTIHKLINTLVECHIAMRDTGYAEDAHYILDNIISLCYDLKYHVKATTGVDY